MELLGCSIESFKRRIENWFKPGMSWENRSKWHLHHVVACAKFDLAKPEHQKRCFHFSNFRPIWGVENQRLGCRTTDQFNLL
jgi:hypothetical protein